MRRSGGGRRERGGGSVEEKPSYRRFSATKEQVGTGLKTLYSKKSFDLLEITSGDLSISVIHITADVRTGTQTFVKQLTVPNSR